MSLSEAIPLVLLADVDVPFRNRLCRAFAQRGLLADGVPYV